jgi:hypothetical protein
MTINGVTYTEKEPAAKALLEACKGIKGCETELPIGDYMDFKLSLSYASFGQTINLMMRGAMTYQTELGTDAFGNIQRINNALDKLPERLEGAKSQLANYEKQVAAAKEELAKPFTQEEELQAKEARLALLNADLNIDGDGGLEIEGDSGIGDENPEIAESSRERDVDTDEDEPQSGKQEYRTSDEPRYSQPNELPRTGTYGKSAPSILDDVRSIKSELKPSAPGGSKSAEIDI